ncbi:HAD hydrolase-like protein [Candidatus Woesearchaeota archaeon]|nr:HAD hydrolase-like protein [Candidatus Woesearchaeota archaeon]
MLIVFDLDDTLYDCSGQMKEATKWQDARCIVPFPGVIDFLGSFPARKILLSRETDAGLQDVKIDALRIRTYFDKIYFCRRNEEKKNLLGKIQQEYSSEDIWVVGDRIDSEIQYGNELRMKTVRLRHGKYSQLEPQNDYQKPHGNITQFSDLAGILRS